MDNPHYRGLGPAQLRWMLTTFHMGHYIPATWLTFAVDHAAWGMDPAGYHLTNVLLHAANAVVFYFIGRRLVAGGLAGLADRAGPVLPWAAALAALLFALHPLRAESVAWVTERRDLLSAFFYLLTILAYLRACPPAGGGEPAATSRPWYVLAVALFAVSLLSKSMAVSLPAVLLILDIYPLRRLRGGWGGWLSGPGLRALAEKIPFVLLSAIASSIAVIAVKSTGITLAPLSALGITDRLALSFYGLAFYIWKTAVPIGLVPLYELTLPVNPLEARFLLAAGVVVLVTAGAIAFRRRGPALAATWLAYVVILLPVLGVAHNGPQIAADRYTYLSCLGWPLLLAGGLLTAWRRVNPVGSGALASGAGVLLLVITAALGGQAWKQVQIWRDSEQLWTHAVAVSPSMIAHHNLGVALLDRGAVSEATAHFREAVRRQPDSARAHNYLGVALARSGDYDRAIPHFAQALRLDPSFSLARSNLDRALSMGGARR